jgi:signal transduction histidine kinase
VAAGPCIALLVRHAGNRGRLHSWSKETLHAEPLTTIDGANVDLIVADPAAFVEERAAIERLRNESQPVFLPCLLVCDPREAERLTAELWRTVDDLVVTPIRPDELRLRIERLLEQRRRTAATEGERAELQRSNVDLERFAFVAAHELATPLAVVSGAVQTVAAHYTRPNETAQGVLAAALEGCQRMQALIEDILDLSRAGSANLDETVDMNLLVADVCQELRDRIRETGSRVVYDRLPLVAGDTAQLRLVFRNLIANALKFGRPEVAPIVEIEATRACDSWQFSVSDNGVGIAAADRDTVFDLFTRSDRSIPGSGIGLAICRRVIERLGGHILIQDREGPGTTFRFTLPAGRR